MEIKINKEIFIETYAGYIKALASRYASSTVPFDDLVQEGMIGLLEAVERFDEKKGVSLSTYATYWIKKRILAVVDLEIKEASDKREYDDDIADKDEKNLQPTENQLPAGRVDFKDLPPEEQKVLDLHFNEGKSLADISKIMDISREKVRQLKQKGLRRLRAKGIF